MAVEWLFGCWEDVADSGADSGWMARVMFDVVDDDMMLSMMNGGDGSVADGVDDGFMIMWAALLMLLPLRLRLVASVAAAERSKHSPASYWSVS